MSSGLLLAALGTLVDASPCQGALRLRQEIPLHFTEPLLAAIAQWAGAVFACAKLWISLTGVQACQTRRSAIRRRGGRRGASSHTLGLTV